MLKLITHVFGVYDKISPIHEAATLGDVSELERLIKEGVNVNLKNYEQHTPLYLAVQNGNELAAKLLLESGANAKNLMRIAVDKGNLKMLQLLDQFGADVEGDKNGPIYPYMKVKDGLHLFHLAAQQGYLDIVKWFVDVKGVSINLSKNPLKQTALHLAAKQGHQDVVEFLLQKNANPDVLDLNENAPVHLAVQQGNLPILKLLKGYEASLEIYGNKSKITPLHVAAKHHYLSIIEYLIDTAKVNINALANGLQIGKLYLPECMQSKYTPLQAATFFPDAGQTIALLVYKRADIDLKHNFGKFRSYIIKHQNAILNSGPMEHQIALGLAFLKVFHDYNDSKTINFKKFVVTTLVTKMKNISEGDTTAKLKEILSTQEQGENFYNFCLATTKDLKFGNIESELKEPYDKILSALKSDIMGHGSATTDSIALAVAGAGSVTETSSVEIDQ
ncbi:hypothetical protein phytr_5280 [Candidatus Phycorickettsia trachydisci]|uniref:Uncharacterized protein n=1 Tax=Candidatus Phycorickettsia trachydisci TaxID=2115978 RepID=A0A2P1P891_9RICK|nr:ankyrin repeat domain-containing protein [Candidatus Phycorickettsia trachydisci]AVP87474.1 hypothetical protein phytr_5280 [Candidatus Phycorickettsia trachydisci]